MKYEYGTLAGLLNYTLTGLDSNFALHHERPATNHLSPSTASPPSQIWTFGSCYWERVTSSV